VPNARPVTASSVKGRVTEGDLVFNGEDFQIRVTCLRTNIRIATNTNELTSIKKGMFHRD